MSLSNYSPELMAIYRGKFLPPSLCYYTSLTLPLCTRHTAYAASLGPTPKPEYKVVHESNSWIQVPPGHLPIRIAQFARGDRSDGKHRLHHWAIFIPTSTRRGVGNFYEIGGSLQTGYFTQHVVHNRHSKWEQEKGAHLIGWVAPSYLEDSGDAFLAGSDPAREAGLELSDLGCRGVEGD
jgi:hypothetical protein